MGKKTKARRRKFGDMNYKGPMLTMRDPKSHVMVAVQSDDRGTPEMLRQVSASLAEFVDDEALPFPLKGIEVGVNGRIQTARRKKDGLDLMHEKGTLGDAELVAAREFQACFDLSQQVRMGSVMFNNSGGAGMGIEDFLQRRIRASDKVDEMIDAAGGVGAWSALAVERIAGRGYTLRRMVVMHGQATHFWRGALVCGLQCIVRDYTQGRRKPTLGRIVDISA